MPKVIGRRPNPLTAPLSFAQQRLYFLDRLEPDSRAYHRASKIRLTGPLQADVLERCLNEIVRRHEVLHTTFTAAGGTPVQTISPHPALSVPVIDVRGLSEGERDARARLLACEELCRPFNLAQGPLLRATLIRSGEQEHVLLLTLHHIVFDGWSMEILLRELSALYGAFSAGVPSPLPDLPIQYGDFADWQRRRLDGEFLDQQLSYWKRHMADAPAVLELPLAHRPPSAPTFGCGSHSLPIPGGLAGRLRSLSRQEGVTLFMTLLASFQTLLSRYTRQEDVVIGSPIAGRIYPHTQDLIGLFINTLVLRTDLSGNPTFRELLGRVRRVSLGAFAHQDLPFERLVEELRPTRKIGRMPLFNVTLNYRNFHRRAVEVQGLRIEVAEVEGGTAIVDLNLDVAEKSGGLECTFKYNEDLFDAPTIRRTAEHFRTLLEGAVEDPGRRISDLPLLTEAERLQLLVEWNNIRADYQRGKCIHHLFEEQVARTPDAVAVVFNEEQLSYRELNERANQLAHYLQELGVGPEVLVGLSLERSVEMVVGLLGILKAGGAYVPLDPEYPEERLRFMLEDAEVSVLLTQEHLVESLPATQSHLVCLDRDWEEIQLESKENPKGAVASDNLAYVIYTSGSTGRPKGVEIPHRGVVRLVKGTNYVDLSSDEVFLQLAPLCFDASTFEIWGCLLNGGSLAVMPPGIPSLAEVSAAVERHRVTTLWLTAGLFHQMVDYHPESLRGVRQLLAGGDVLSVRHVKKVLAGLGEGQRLINGYGPTENTTFTCCHRMSGGERVGATVPIGRPISNTEVYILDHNQQVVPVGVAGELYIGGEGLARCYVNRPELTAERFIPDPFSGEPGARLYKTGDVVRYLEDGKIEFLGRMDHQVKLRGYRIELGEVESVLCEHRGVEQAVVLAREESPQEKRLVAYVLADPAAAPDISELRSYVKRRLPEYMVPQAFVMLDALPLTPNGKVDRRRLPEPLPLRPQLSPGFLGPRDPLEAQLAQIWEELLGLERVGIRDNFFDLGGHSLLAVAMVSRIDEVCGQRLPLATLFVATTIEELAVALLRQRGAGRGAPPLIKIQGGGKRPPFFYLHGDLHGGGLYCLRLARALGADQPFYALQPLGIDGQEVVPATIEAMAEEHLKAVRQVQPQGPYRLGGHCNGGLIAFEMARRLREAGEEVALLVVIDAALQNNRYKLLRWAVRAAGQAANLTPEAELEWFLRMKRAVRVCVEKRGKERGLDLAKRVKNLMKKVGRRLVSIEGVKGRPEGAAGATRGRMKERHHSELNGKYVRALEGYVAQRYAGKVTLFWPAGAGGNDEGRSGEWRKVAREVEVHRVPGEHLTCLTKHIGALAGHLRTCLNDTQNG